MIVFDIDGVIARSDPFLIEGLSRFTKTPFKPSTPRVYDYFEYFDISKRNYHKVIHDSIVNNTDKITPYKTVTKALHYTYKRQNHVIFLTSRPNTPEMKYCTYSWIKSVLPYSMFVSIIFKGNRSKEEIMKEYGYDAIVEDRLRTANSITNKVYLINRPWNINRDTNINVKRVPSPLTAVELYFKNKRTKGGYRKHNNRG